VLPSNEISTWLPALVNLTLEVAEATVRTARARTDFLAGVIKK